MTVFLPTLLAFFSLNGLREGRCTIHQVHSDIILQDLCKDDRLSEEDSWEERSIDQYLQQKEQNWEQ